MITCNLEFILMERAIRPFVLSKETDLPRTFINALINNNFQSLNVKQIDKLCTYLKISYDELFSFSPIFISYTDITITKDKVIEFTAKLSFPNELLEDIESEIETDDKVYITEQAIKIICTPTTQVEGDKEFQAYLVDIDDNDYEQYCYIMFDIEIHHDDDKRYNYLIDLQRALITYVKTQIPNKKTPVFASDRFIYDERDYEDTISRLKILRETLSCKIKRLERRENEKA